MSHISLKAALFMKTGKMTTEYGMACGSNIGYAAIYWDNIGKMVIKSSEVDCEQCQKILDHIQDSK